MRCLRVLHNIFHRNGWLWLAAVLLLSMPFTVQGQAGAPNAEALLHDSRDTLYRAPGGAVPAGTTVYLRLRTAPGDIDAAGVWLRSSATGTVSLLPMQAVATTPDGFQYWEARLETGTVPTVYYYRFQLSRSGTLYLYEDDTVTSGGEYVEANKGGVGVLHTSTTNANYQIAVYDPAYYTPEWMRDAVVYQIFPDRFRDGDPTNNPTDDGDLFYGDVPLYFHETWNEPMLDGRVDLLPSGAGWWNADFYGGDLAGITEKLDYLQSLGVTAIYLNPIFAARSNHRYDTADYRLIDPLLGTLDDFRRLVTEAEARGMRLILDGVFNHLSSDSVFFDRYGRYETDGACESVESEWRNWFTFVEAEGGQPAPCAGENGALYYVSWAGFDSIPQVNNTLFPARAYFVRGQDSIVRAWGAEGIGGWRLDAAEQVDNGTDPENGYWEAFRQVARLTDPEAVVIGEYWQDATEWLVGDEWDSVTNYRFRRAVIGVVRGDDYVDGDGPIPGLRPSAFAESLRSLQEDTPPMAYYALMNVMDSHDTSRVLYALDNDPQALRLAALAQFTLPGAPVVYYGSEIALDAPSVRYGDRIEDDPFNRAPYPWADEEGDHYPAPDEAMLAFYQAMGQMRRTHSALRQGAFQVIASEDARGLLAYLRVDAAGDNAALVVLNMSDEAQTLDAEFSGLLPTTLTMRPVFEQDDFSQSFSTLSGQAVLTVAPRSGNVWVSGTAEGAFQSPPPPGQLLAESAEGSVTLTWEAVDGVDKYVVYRSPVQVGGFMPLAEVSGANGYMDRSVENGTLYHYRVASVSAAGIVGEQGDSAAGRPAYAVTMITVPGAGAGLEPVTLSYGLAVPVEADIVIAGVTGGDAPVPGVVAQAALVVPDSADAAVYVPMVYAGALDGADRYSVELLPTTAGTFEIDIRFSVDGGATWQYAAPAAGEFRLTVLEAADADAPPAPGALTIVRAAPGVVTMTWTASTAEDVAAYRVFRDGAALADVPAETLTYSDLTAFEGGTYTYSVLAVDAAANLSVLAAANPVLVERGKIAVTFLVNVPPATNSDVYLAGDLGSAEFPLWDPAGIVLAPAGENQWAVTLQFSEGTTLNYKFVRGGWEAVEKGTECEEIADRTLTINLDVLGEPEADGTYVVEHTVARWRDLDACP